MASGESAVGCPLNPGAGVTGRSSSSFSGFGIDLPFRERQQVVDYGVAVDAEGGSRLGLVPAAEHQRLVDVLDFECPFRNCKRNTGEDEIADDHPQTLVDCRSVVHAVLLPLTVRATCSVRNAVNARSAMILSIPGTRRHSSPPAFPAFCIVPKCSAAANARTQPMPYTIACRPEATPLGRVKVIYVSSNTRRDL